MLGFWVGAWFIVSSCMFKSFSGVAMGMWMVQAVCALVFMFSAANWEGWLVLSLVYLGGIFVLMLYIGCSDTYSTFSVGFTYYLLSFLILAKVGSLCSVNHNSMPEALWFTSSSSTVLLVSGFVLCGVMVVTNTFIYASEGALRGLSHCSMCVHKLVSFKDVVGVMVLFFIVMIFIVVVIITGHCCEDLRGVNSVEAASVPERCLCW